jgi:2-polyprenyl-3-methyl-5-hydroxy-6-metoxy-1,4-benzoquinol methylase
MKIDEIARRAKLFETHLNEVKAGCAVDFPWYPYGTLDNFHILDRTLTGEHRDLIALMGQGPVLDIGAADGELAFFVESLGIPTHVVDFPTTNCNGCRGVRRLREAMSSKIEIFESDIDRTFALGQGQYTFAFFLGILYHLKNPYGVLESLAQRVRHAVISTRVTRYNVASAMVNRRAPVNNTLVDLQRVPAAYLVAPDECNNDATNFWMFSEAGLRRILYRTGWDVLDFATFGNREDSDPATAAGDERAFCLVRSRYFN